MIRIIEEGTAKRHGYLAEFKVTSTDPESVEAPQRLEVQVYRFIGDYKCQTHELVIYNLRDSDSLVTVDDMSEETEVTHNQRLQGLTCYIDPKTWAFIALDIAHNS